MRITESKLRSVIKGVIRENFEEKIGSMDSMLLEEFKNELANMQIILTDRHKKDDQKISEIMNRIARAESMLKKYEEILKDEPMSGETREERFYDYLNN